MVKTDVIGTVRPRKQLIGPEWQIRILVAFKVAIAVVVSGFVVIKWMDFLNPLLIGYAALVVILPYLVGAAYHLPGTIFGAIDFITGGVFAAFMVLISYYIFRDSDPLSYYYAIPLWLFVFLLTLADKNSKHVLMVKFSVVFYVFSIFNESPNADFMAKTIYYIVIISLALPSGITFVVSMVVYPTFSSHLIMPEVVECIRELRNLQSLLGYHLALRSSKFSPLPSESELQRRKERNWKAIGDIEESLSDRMERMKKYWKDSQIETWNKDNVKRYGDLVTQVEKLYWLIIGKRVSIAKYYPTFSPLDAIPLLDTASTELIVYMDKLITCLETIHLSDFPTRGCVNVAPPEFPNIESLQSARQAVHEDFRETSKKMFEENNEVPFTAFEITVLASILSSMQAIGRQVHTVATMVQTVPPTTFIEAYKHVPKAVVMSTIMLTKMLWLSDLGYGLFDELKKKQPWKERISEHIHSKKWRYPFRFATCVAAALPISTYLAIHHADDLHITLQNRTYFVITTLMVIVPTQGSTIGRGVHRTVGTLLGACVSYLFAWAVLSTSGPNNAARWVVMQVLLFILSFLGLIVQQMPGTGYAMLLFNITIPLLAVPTFHLDIDHIPKSIATTRFIYIAIASVWAVIIFLLFVPIRSINNLKLSLMNCVCTSGKAFTTIVECGVLLDREGKTQLSDEERKQLIDSLSTLHTAQGLHKLLLLDAYWETFYQHHIYHDFCDAVNHTRNLIHKLIVIETLYDNGFEEPLARLVITPLRKSINHVLRPISARVAVVSEQRAALALRKKTTRVQWLSLPKSSKLRKRSVTKTPSACDDCKKLKDCEKHARLDTSQAMERLDSSGIEASPTRKSAGLEQVRLQIGANNARTFDDLQEDLQKVRLYLYRSNVLAMGTWVERAEALRFFAMLYAMGQFVHAWDEMRETMLRLGLEVDLAGKAPMRPEMAELDTYPEIPVVGEEVVRKEEAEKTQEPEVAESPEVAEFEVEVEPIPVVQLRSLKESVMAQQQDELEILSEENKGGVAN